MPRAKFTQYYKNAIDNLIGYLDEKQQLCIRLEDITKESATITIGVSDGKEMVLEFGTVAMRKGYVVHVKSDNIYVDMHKMIHMEYNTNPETDCALPMIEAWNS
jgi:hypothetical protein